MERDTQRLIDALSSPIRRDILWLVRDREMAAGEIAAAFEVGSPTVSQHLAVLRESGLVEMRVDGTYRRYRARLEALRGLETLIAGDGKWQPTLGLPEGALATANVELVACVSVEVPLEPDEAFDSFIDPERFGAWLGVPVSIVDGRFACTMEFGRTVRGTYEAAVRPLLIAMRWDFDESIAPVPGDERDAYLRITPIAGGSRVEVQQLAGDGREAAFLTNAWSLVLGRLKQSCS